jgi:anhydro-N-acetylmuramic acid kinase
MKEDYYNVIGVMSGTSLDGIDLAHIQFHKNSNKWTFEILESETVSYSNEWVNVLKSAVDFSELELNKTNREYTKYLASVISNFIKKNEIENLDAVCSHGHTILHQPEKGITLQIGNLPEISSLIHQMVVCDFRVQDVLLEGQGAPLVPIGDRLLFPEYDYCMNLGGFSNVSYEQNGRRIAFDISPLNTVLNFYANQLGLDYDDKGSISRSGKINHNLLVELNKLEYYQRKHPKSLGFEFVKATILPLIENFKINTEDKLRTFTEHAAMQIALALPNKKGSLLITGGGAYNNFFIERTQIHLPEIKIIIPQAKILEFKEALIFALLGILKIRDENNVLSSVTGATADHSSGVIYSLK